MGGIRHAKTNNIEDWDQNDLNQAISRGQFPQGTLLEDIALPSDWNAEHTVDLTTLDAKAGLSDGDLFGIADSLDAYEFKKVTFDALQGAIKSNLGPFFGVQPELNPPADDDAFVILDASSGDTLAQVKWSQVKTALNAVFAAIVHNHSGADITSGTVGATYGGTGFNGSAAANGALPIGNSTGFTLATLTAGTNVIINNAAGAITIAVTGGGGAGPTVELQTFTANGTWTRPAGIVYAQGWCIAAGGGSGSGRRGATTVNRTGGGGGGGGAIAAFGVSGGLVGATETVTVGVGGTAGAAQTVNDTDGNAGTAGGNSSFGSWCQAIAGTAGAGGNSTTTAAAGAAGGATGSTGGIGGSAGGTGRNTTGSNGAAIAADGCAGGAGGGGAPNGGGSAAGGNGGTCGSSTASGYAVVRTGGTGGTTGGAAATAGTSGPGTAIPIGGSGGGGGAFISAGASTAGAAGGFPGGGGGGGGASDNGNNSGAGAAGAGGMVIVLSWCT